MGNFSRKNQVHGKMNDTNDAEKARHAKTTQASAMEHRGQRDNRGGDTIRRSVASTLGKGATGLMTTHATGDHDQEKSQNVARQHHLHRIDQTNNASSAWEDYLNWERKVLDCQRDRTSPLKEHAKLPEQPDHHQLHNCNAAIIKLYSKALRCIPIEQNRNDLSFIRIWLEYIGLLRGKEHRNESEIRDLFKYLKSTRIGHGHACFYIQWAKFEVSINDKDRAREILERGLEKGALPKLPLQEALGHVDKENFISRDWNVLGQPDASIMDERLAEKENVSDVILAGKEAVHKANVAPQRKVLRQQALKPPSDSSSPDTSCTLTLSDGDTTTGDKMNDVDTTLVGKMNDGDTTTGGKGNSESISDTTMIVPRSRKFKLGPPIRQRVNESSQTSSMPLSSETKVDQKQGSTVNREESGHVVANSLKPTNYVPDNQVVSEKKEPSVDVIKPPLRLQDVKCNPPIIVQPKADSVMAHRKPPLMNEKSAFSAKDNRTSKKSLEDGVHRGSKASTKKLAGMIVVNSIEYTKLQLIGRGGSSKVYKVLSPSGELYALKKVSLEGSDPTIAQGYLNEIELLRKLSGSDRIIRLIDSVVNMEEETIHMVMELGEIDLAHFLKRFKDKTRDDNFIRYCWQQLLEAVEILHKESIVHLDLKPANFVLVKGTWKLIDFGISKSIQNDMTSVTRDSQVGTINFMSPEALIEQEHASHEKRIKIGRSSDVWSLGCILYQMVYGAAPYARYSIIQRLRLIMDETHQVDYPMTGNPAVIESIQLCLKKNPKARATIKELQTHRFVKPIWTLDEDHLYRCIEASLEEELTGFDQTAQLAKAVTMNVKRRLAQANALP